MPASLPVSFPHADTRSEFDIVGDFLRVNHRQSRPIESKLETKILSRTYSFEMQRPAG